MLVKLLSDLHLHGSDPFKYVDHGEEVCVLAGDISEGMHGVHWAELAIPSHIQVIYVPGNHEYYNQDYALLQERFKVYNSRGSHVQVLDKECLSIRHVDFVCATLWTDFDVYKNQPLHAQAWKRGLNDAHYIKYGGDYLNPNNFVRWNKEALTFLSGEANKVLQPDAVRVLVTHYCPELSVAPRWRGHMLTPGFATKIPSYIYDKFDFHFHGHTHDSMDYEHLGVKVKCNPRGYGSENFTGFNEELVLDI